MKKHLVLAAAALAFGFSAAYAQVSVLKEAERAQKGGKSPAEVVTIITPAFTDSETSGLAQTYFIPGSAYFNEFDDLFKRKALNMLPEGGENTMGKDLLAGYDYYMKALPLDTVVDEKGKVKTKYSKDIVKTIANHVNDFSEAGVGFYNTQDYADAYKALGIFVDINENPLYAGKIMALPDSLVGLRAYYQGLCAYYTEDLAGALAAFEHAKNKDYKKKPVYEAGVSVATMLNNQDAVVKWAKEAHELFGEDDPQFIGFIIDSYIKDNDYDKALSTIDEAISLDPNNSQYYYVKGVILSNQDKRDEAKGLFKKAIELDPNNARALHQYGVSLALEAGAISDSAPATMTVAETEKQYNEVLKPLYTEAAEYLEKAWDLDNTNTSVLNALEIVYYQLRDENMVKDVQKRKGE